MMNKIKFKRLIRKMMIMTMKKNKKVLANKVIKVNKMCLNLRIFMKNWRILEKMRCLLSKNFTSYFSILIMTSYTITYKVKNLIKRVIVF